MVSETELVDKITSRAKDIGVQVWLHAADLDSARQVGIDAAEPVVTASVFKVPVGLELARQAADGPSISPSESRWHRDARPPVRTASPRFTRRSRCPGTTWLC